MIKSDQKKKKKNFLREFECVEESYSQRITETKQKKRKGERKNPPELGLYIWGGWIQVNMQYSKMKSVGKFLNEKKKQKKKLIYISSLNSRPEEEAEETVCVRRE